MKYLPKQGPRCRECPLFESGISVLDRPPPDRGWSGLSIVGETPGSREVDRGFVFVGPSGKFLDTLMQRSQIVGAYVTNAIRCGLPHGDKPNNRDMARAAECCRPAILDNLRAVKSRSLLCLGATSTYSLLGLGTFSAHIGFGGIEKVRGTCIPPSDEMPWISTCSIHPAAILRPGGQLRVIHLTADLLKAERLAKGQVEIWNPSVYDWRDTRSIIRWLKSNTFSSSFSSAPISIDVETWGPTPLRAKDALLCELRTIGLAANGSACSIPWPTFYALYDQKDEKCIVDLVRKLLACDRPKVFHNKMFDVPVLERHVGSVNGVRHDTMILHHVLYPRLPHDLQSVASQFLACTPWKSEYTEEDTSGLWSAPEETFDQLEELLQYNARDALATLLVFDHMYRELHRMDLGRVYENDITKQDDAIGWYKTGICIDLEKLQVLKRQYRRNLIRMLKEIQDLVARVTGDPARLGLQSFHGIDPDGMRKGFGFNPRSPRQLNRLLFEVLGMTPTVFTEKTFQPSTSKDALWEMRDSTEYLRLHFEYKEKSQIYSTYLKGLNRKLHPDGRLHSTWKCHVIPSGRFSSQPAVQNWTVDMMEMMIAPSGFCVIGADYSLLEVRGAAVLAAEWPLIEALRRGEDIHSRNAALFYYPEIWKDADEALRKKLRRNGKPVTFLMNYMGSADAAYEAIKKDRPGEPPDLLRQEAAILVDRYKAGHPAIVRAADTYLRQANTQFYLRTALLGRVLPFPGGQASPTDAANFPVQGVAADIKDLGSRKWHDSLRESGRLWKDVFPILDIHDALFAYARVEVAEEERLRLQECLSCTLTITSPVTGEPVEMEFPAEAQVGRTVAQAKGEVDALTVITSTEDGARVLVRCPCGKTQLVPHGTGHATCPCGQHGELTG